MAVSRLGVSLIVWMGVWTVILTAVLACRFWSLKIKRRALRVDDLLVVLSYIGVLTNEAIVGWGIAHGLGAHTKDVPKDDLVVQFQVLLAAGIALLFTTVCCKCAILWLYASIFSLGKFPIVARVMMAISVGYGVSFLVVFLTNCSPVDYMWHPVPGGHCKDITIEEEVNTAINLAIDVAIVLLPIPPVWKLQMPISKKLGVSALFGIGLVVSAVMIWRVWLQGQPEVHEDYVYSAGLIGFPGLLEIYLGIIVACLPTVTPVYAQYIKPFMRSIRKSSDKSKGTSEPWKGQLQTIGSWKARKNPKTDFELVDSASFLDLEEARLYANAQEDSTDTPPPVPTVAPQPSFNVPTMAERALVGSTQSIGVRNDIKVCSEPRRW